MLKKFMATVSAAALLAGAAHAVELENLLPVVGIDEVYPLAAELAYEDGDVTGDLSVGFGPSAGNFPTGNVLIRVELTNAEFNRALNGSEVVGTTTSVISTGGQNGASVVTFLVSGADACAVAGQGAGSADCEFTLPVALTGGPVSIAVGIETDAGAPVDNTDIEDGNFVELDLIEVVPAFNVDFTADEQENLATIDALFTTLDDDYLGDIIVEVNEGSDGYAVYKNLIGTEVLSADVEELNILLEGNMDAFADGDIQFAGESADDIDATTDEAVYAAGSDSLGTYDVIVVPDDETPIARSTYTASVEIVPTVASGLTANTTAEGELEPITREGASVVFPWTQSATLGAVSGATSVFRIANLDASDAGAVFVEVKNSADGETGYDNPGIVQLADGIEAGGEFVTNSALLEGALGNYGRGDLEFTIEADTGALTGRQFVVRNGVIQQVTGGTLAQDLGVN